MPAGNGGGVAARYLSRLAACWTAAYAWPAPKPAAVVIWAWVRWDKDRYGRQFRYTRGGARGLNKRYLQDVYPAGDGFFRQSQHWYCDGMRFVFEFSDLFVGGS